MQRTRRERYEAQLMHESDEDKNEKDEKQQLEAELLVEKLELEGGEGSEGKDDKENRPPDVSRSSPWDGKWMVVQRMAEEAEQR